MSKSIAELRASAHVGLPERTYKLCLATKVMAEVQDLCAQLERLEEQKAEAAAGQQTGPKKRAAEKSPAEPIRKRIAELRDEMDSHTGVLTLRGIDEGVWRIWCDEHPPRPDVERDARIGRGFCNADDLIDDLETYAVLWNGEPIKPTAYDAKGEVVEAGEWSFLKANSSPGDLKQIAVLVVEMHETVVDLPKLLSALRGIPGADPS